MTRIHFPPTPLPEAPVDAPSPDRSFAAAPERLGHVLIVDDNEINLRVAKSLCELLGLTSELARDGLEAIDAMREGAFDLVLMDICMPGVDGVEAARAIRALPGPAADVPIVAVTANVEPKEVAGYLAAGMRAVVAKPVKISCLVTAIREALEASPPRQHAAAC